MTHKFTMEAWIKMQRGAKGGTVVERKIDVMLIPDKPDWRSCHRIVITDLGQPKVEWEGEVTILTPVRESNILVRFDVALEVVTRNVSSEVDIRDGKWHHLAAVGNSRNVKLYIDGKMDVRVSGLLHLQGAAGAIFRKLLSYLHATRQCSSVSDNDLQANTDDDLDAVVDEVIFWNEDRSQEEIVNQMQYGLSVKDIRSGLRAINPVPEFAVDDGDSHEDLISI